MKVCLLSSGHSPADERIFYKEARSLAGVYDEVWIVSPHASEIPVSRDGVSFLPIRNFPRNLRGRAGTIRELTRVALDLGADVYHCHEPESLLAALETKKRLGCKVIFDSHEMYGAALAQRFPAVLHRPVMGAYSALEKRKVRQCDFVIGASWSISEHLSRFAGPEKTETILNCPLPGIFGEAGERPWGDETVLCHDGSLPFSRGLVTMVRAVGIVSRRHRVRLRIVGDVYGAERAWLQRYVREHRLEGVIETTGWLDYRDVGKAMAGCHIGLIALERLPNHVIAAPNKLFNYMHFGMPVVVPDFCIDMKRLVGEERCGIAADSASAESYAAAITVLIEQRDESEGMGRRAASASRERYSWTVMERRLLGIYRGLEVRRLPALA